MKILVLSTKATSDEIQEFGEHFQGYVKVVYGQFKVESRQS